MTNLFLELVPDKKDLNNDNYTPGYIT